jgi:hypothetical protein
MGCLLLCLSDQDGRFIIAGNTLTTGGDDVYLIKTDASGDTLWTRTYGSTTDSEYGKSVLQTEDGGFIITGYIGSWGAYDIYLVKTDSSGDTLWTRTYGDSDDDQSYSIQQTSDGGYIITGFTGSWGAYDVYLIKTDASGDTLWTRTYGSSDDDKSFSVQQTLDNNYIITGFTGSWGAYDVYLIKVAGEQIVGDFNSDGYVDAADLQLLGDHWHFVNTDPGWDPLYDLVPDNIIDAADLQVFGDHWHEGTPPRSGQNGRNGRGPNENAGIVFDLDATTTGNQNLTGIPSQPVGTHIRVDVYCTDVQNLDTYEFEVIYNPSELEYVTATPTNPITYEGNILESNGGTALGWMIDTSTPGVLSIAYTLAGNDPLEAPEGEGLIADIVFLSLVDTYGTLSFGDVYYYDSYGVVDLITNTGTASIGPTGLPIPPAGGTVIFPAGGSITFPPGCSGTIDLTFDPVNPPPGIPVGSPQTLWWDFDTSLATIVYPVHLRLEWPFDPGVTYASSAVLHQTEAVWYALIDGNPIAAHAANLPNQGAILASITYDFDIDPSFVEFDTWTLSDWGMDGDSPLPVTLTNFAAEFVSNNLTILWTTQSETNNQGWNIYRGESNTALEDDNTIQINAGLIDGTGTTSEPTNYEFIDEYPVVENNTYWYWLESVGYSNDTGIYGPISLTIPIGETPPPLPTLTLLKGNYPNPFNPTTTIQFDIKEGETAELTIFNIRGQIVESKTFEAGAYNYEWNSKDNASGVYFYKLSSESYSEFKKMMLLK